MSTNPSPLYVRRRRIAAAIAASALVVGGAGVVSVLTGDDDGGQDHSSAQTQGTGSGAAGEGQRGGSGSGSGERLVPEARIPSTPRPLADAPRPDSVSTVTLDSSGSQRRALLVVPTAATAAGTPGRPLPLILAFPGWKETPQMMSHYAGLGRGGAIVAYAEGKNLAWEGAPYATRTRSGEDIQFVKDLLDGLSSTYNVDRHRVYAVGMSNGGGFAAKLACELPRDFAAIASVAGAYYPKMWQGCAAPGAAGKQGAFAPGVGVPFLEIHGQSDETMKYVGGVRHATPYLGAMQFTRAYASRTGCSGSPLTTRIADGVLRTQWASCLDGVDITQLSLEQAKHEWPEEPRSADASKPSQSSAQGSGNSGSAEGVGRSAVGGSAAVTATREILAFFERHAR